MKDYMTADEVCAYFNIVSSTLYDWRRDGLIVTKVGKRVFFSAEDIKSFLDTKRVCEYQR